jgi:hypothetical protein
MNEVEVRTPFPMMYDHHRALQWSARFLFSPHVDTVMGEAFEKMIGVLEQGNVRLRIWGNC